MGAFISSVVLVLSILRILDIVGFPVKIKFATIAFEIIKDHKGDFNLKIFPYSEEKVSLVNYSISSSKNNSLTPSNFTALVKSSSNIPIKNEYSDKKDLYIHFLFQKRNGKRVKRTRKISKLLRTDWGSLRLRKIKIII
jgi:hypothetical protein